MGYPIVGKLLREKLHTHGLVKTRFKTKDGGTIYLRQTSEPDDYQKMIYRVLGFTFKPIKAEKTIIPKEDVVSKK